MDKQVINFGEQDNPDKSESIFKKFSFAKLMTGKNLKIVVLVIIMIIAAFLFLGLSTTSNSNTTSTSDSFSGYTTTFEYCRQLEEKLQSVLSNIKGAGNVSVMVSVNGSPELVYASDTDVKTSSSSSGSTTTNSASPIIVNVNGKSTALVLTENLPEVKGVIVVSSGASDVSIKVDILKAVSTLLDISTDKISVLKGI